MLYPLSDVDDAVPQYFDADTGNVVTVVNTDPLQRLCYEHQKDNGFTPDRRMRRVAHIELSTVKLLAKMGDNDAHAYFYEHDTKARDRMIRRHPAYFKACAGGI